MNHVFVSVSRAFLLIMALCLLSVPMRADDAAAVFKAKCVACHAADGSGNTPMGIQLKSFDLRSPEAQKLTDAELTEIITNGSKGKMPAWGKLLKPEDIKGLVAYIRTLAAKGKTK
jgi:mono/diheme cytochrome c family protein